MAIPENPNPLLYTPPGFGVKDAKGDMLPDGTIETEDGGVWIPITEENIETQNLVERSGHPKETLLELADLALRNNAYARVFVMKEVSDGEEG